jgi:hypothetical protein
MLWKLMVIGFFALIGLTGYACCVAAGRADEQSERYYQEWEENHKDE